VVIPPVLTILLASIVSVFVCHKSFHSTLNKYIFQGPICRYPLKEQNEYHISYSLEEASRLFQLLKNTIDWSTIKLPSAPVVSESKDVELVHRDMICARRLQAELDREIRNEPSRRSQVLVQNQPLPIAEIPREATINNLPSRQENSGRPKSCGHRCDLVSTKRCCLCSGKIAIEKACLFYLLICFTHITYFIDRRPHRGNNDYEAYVDGRGMENRATRDEYYCPCCKHR
jgi:hypothetical protein